MPVFGPGIPAGTTILGVSGSTVTLSSAATLTSAVPLTYNTTVGAGSNTVTLSPAEAGTLTVGQVVSAANVAPNTTIQSVNVATGVVTLVNANALVNPTLGTPALQNITFGGATVAFGNTQNFSATAGPLSADQSTTTINNTTMTLLAAAPATVVPGMSVSGPGIDPGTTVAAVTGKTVTLSQVASASAAPIVNLTAQLVTGLAFLLAFSAGDNQQ